MYEALWDARRGVYEAAPPCAVHAAVAAPKPAGPTTTLGRRAVENKQNYEAAILVAQQQQYDRAVDMITAYINDEKGRLPKVFEIGLTPPTLKRLQAWAKTQDLSLDYKETSERNLDFYSLTVDTAVH